MLATTTALTLLLLLRTATDDTIAVWLNAAITLWVVSVWFLLPIWVRRRYPPNR
ncbi:hypothetical protein [Streptomyces sp. NPDC093093]|uniref:hypothetical protein n=1 Tax=Streptomyces sp. NPDC093093 TaxID=3366025 RepID=UPI00382B1EC0